LERVIDRGKQGLALVIRDRVPVVQAIEAAIAQYDASVKSAS
jgi:hypothetical protein